MRLEEIQWFEEPAKKDMLSRVYAFTRYLPDKVIAMYSSQNNNFFDTLKSNRAAYIIATSTYYKDLLHSRHYPFIVIREAKLRHITKNEHPISSELKAIINSYFKSSVIKKINEAWKRLLSLRTDPKIRLGNGEVLELLKTITMTLLAYVKLLFLVFGNVLKPLLDFLNMVLTGFEEIKLVD